MADQFDAVAAALADRYTLLRELGAGGMATVYLAEDLKHDRKVAIKVLRPELAAVLGAERFIQEIKTTANLQHPNILPLFDSGKASVPPLPAGERGTGGERPGGSAQDFLYYVMPFVEGETLRDKLNRETQLGIDEAVRLTTEVAEALDYAHRHGVIHRDIKPENILLHDGRPLVADFGIALAVSAAAGGRMTETGLSLGTPHYMSPEQATAEKELTARSDIYSLGAVLYEMLTGDPPHTGSSAQQIIMKIVTEEAAPVTRTRKAVPPNVAAAVEKSLAKLPADRFATAAALAGSLADPGFRTGSTEAAAGVASPRAGGWAGWAVSAALALLLVWSMSNRGSEDSVAASTVTRLTIPVPDGHAGSGWHTQLAVSRDGRTVAYVSGGTLYTRDLSADSAVSIYQGDVSGLGFAPDGQSLVFWESQRLHTIPSQGGPATTLAGASSFGTGTDWADGRIYYSRVDGIYTVPERGGVPERVTSLADETETQHQWPQLLEGNLLMYTVVGPSLGWEDSKLVLHDLSSDERVWSLDHAMFGRYVASGYVIHARADGTAMATPFDLDRRRPTGPPTPLLTGIRLGDDGGSASLAVSDGGTAVYVRAPTVGRRIIERRDLRGTRLGQVGEATEMDQPYLSADGTQLVMTRRTPTNDDVWIVDVGTGRSERFTFDLREDETPIWSPDGSTIVFTAYGGSKRHVYRQSVTESAPELIYASDYHVHVTSWSPDGRWILMTYPDTTRSGDVVALELGDSVVAHPVLTSSAGEFDPVFSPDGRWMAYTSDEAGIWNVFVRSWPFGAQPYQVSVDGGYTPAWSADSRTLYYLVADAQRRWVMAATVRTEPRFARQELDTLFSFPTATSYEHQLLVRGNDELLLLSENQAAIPKVIDVILNFPALLAAGADPIP